ncbi:MAG: sigma-70 family RNA polymerase sigma factor [Bacilli bacterium]|nr:sigma-70 family RNA polymerase sigma factor [Bacilli bacterium]
MPKNKVEIVGIDTNRLKVLSSDESLDLLKKYRETRSKEYLDDLVKGNLKLVLSIVNKYNKKNEIANDLFQIGTLGLLKGINNFDLSLDVKFSTYAVPMIDGEIRRYLRDSSILRISRQIKDTAYHFMKEKERYINEFGTIPSNEEMAKKLKIDPYLLQEAIESTLPISSLSEPLYNDFDQSILLQDVVSDNNYTEEKMINYLSLKQGIDSLNNLERDIIQKRYYQGKSQIEIAKIYNISQAQVSRLEKNALTFLRKFLI